MAIDKRNHFPSKKFNNIIHNITINIHSDINPSHYYPYIHEIANTLANYLHHQAANNPIKAYANKQLQACHYQNPAFLSHINIPLLCASKTHPHDDSTIIREITHLIKNNFAGYFWAMNGREPIFSKSLCLISEQMHKNYLEQIQILEKEFHFKTDDLNTALFTHIEPIRITLESPEYVKAKQVIRTVMKPVQQPVTDAYGRIISFNTVMQPTQELAYEPINPAISSAIPNQPHVSGLFTHAQPQAVSTSYTANNNGDDNFVTRINGKPATGTREFYVKQALERLSRQAANLSKPISSTQVNNLNPTYNLSSAVVEPTGNSKLYSTPEETVSFNLYDTNNPLDNYTPSGSRANELYANILPTNRANGGTSRTPDGLDINTLRNAKPVVDPNNTEWEEVPNDTPWVHSIYQPRPNVYNERAFDRKLFKRIKDGKVQMKEEFVKKMEYDYHYLADSRSDQVASAEYDKAKNNIANRTNREVEEISNKEAENEVMYLLPTPESTEWREIYKHNKVEYSLSTAGMFWYHNLVKAKVIADCVASKKETPDAYISNCFKCVPSTEYPEAHQKFIEDLCQADSWLAVKAVITKHATYQTRNFRRRLELYLTREINLILTAAIGIGWSIGSFYDDIEDLHKEIEADYGEIYLKALGRSYKKGSIFINHLSDSDVETFRSKAADILVPYEDLADTKDFTCVARKSLVLSVCESSGDLEIDVGYNKSKQITPKEARRLYKLLDDLLNEVGSENEVYLTTEDSVVYRVFRNELDSTLITLYNDTCPSAK